PIGLVCLLAAKAMGAAKVVITAAVTENATIADNCACPATQPGGVLMIVGCGRQMATIPLLDAALKEVDIRGNLRYCNDATAEVMELQPTHSTRRDNYPTALAMIASGQVNVKPLVTHRYSLEQTLEAFEFAKKGEGIKVMIHCDKTKA
ncbi:hypothetical protein Bbelb_141330, partial [Branchiostoma belcheri]